jgi:hypothetical protein
LGNAFDHTRRILKAWNKTKTPGALENEDTSWRHPTQGVVWRRPRKITHKGQHPMAQALWALTRRLMELHFHNQNVWTRKWRAVILCKVTLTTCGTKGEIEEVHASHLQSSRIVHVSTTKDHSQWKARRLRYTLNSQGTFEYENFIYIYSYSYPIVWFDSMPYTFMIG